tara:strand:+ start:887 stop:1498 length:612 start_codon:yes stop_codon:yes gene_type:complete
MFLSQKNIIDFFKINAQQENNLNRYISSLKKHNEHTNLVGKSTLSDPWKSHLLDSIQLISYINDQKKSIVDMGTGAGIPGVVLAIMGYKNVSLVDSNGKKTKFLNLVRNSIGVNFDIYSERIENLNNIKFDVITSRALANLNQLIVYSQKFLKKNSVLIFLKGKTVNDEVRDAKKNWIFELKKHQSMSDKRGSVIILKNIKKL